MTVTSIAQTLNDEFVAAVRAAEANDRAEIEALIEEFNTAYQQLLTDLLASDRIGHEIADLMKRRERQEDVAYETYQIAVSKLARRMGEMRDNKTARPSGSNIRLLTGKK